MRTLEQNKHVMQIPSHVQVRAQHDVLRSILTPALHQGTIFTEVLDFDTPGTSSQLDPTALPIAQCSLRGTNGCKKA